MSCDKTIITNDTTALKQKGYFQEKGFFGDHSISQDNSSFNNAINIASSYLQNSRSVLSSPSLVNSSNLSTTRNKTNNYFLYDNEKQLLEQKANEFSALKFVPFDVIEQFLVILVYIDNINDLKYISEVVAIPELNNANIIREPIEILSIPTLYKIAYLANALASINMQYSSQYNASLILDYQANPYSSIYNSASSGGSLSSFPYTMLLTSILGSSAAQLNLTSLITNPFSVFNTFNVSQQLSSFAQLPQVITQITGLNNTLSTTLNMFIKSGIGKSLSYIPQLGDVTRKVRDLNNIAMQLQNITTIATTSSKKSDIHNQMMSLSSQVTSTLSSITNLQSLISKITGPGNIGNIAQTLLKTQFGGLAPTSILTELTLGQRIPPSMLYNNPTLQSPSYMGKAFFGESLSPQAAIDQTFSKVIGAFPSPTNGSGAQSFSFQNFGSFNQTMTVKDAVAKILTGRTTLPDQGVVLDIINNRVNTVTSFIDNINENTSIDMTRSDNSIPFITALSTAISEQDNTPFSTDVHADGWKLAASVTNTISQNNQQMLDTLRQSA